MKSQNGGRRPLAGIMAGVTPPRRGEASSRCPECGGSTIVPVVYGYPSPEMFDAAARDEISLGGCIAHAESPTWRCTGCGSQGVDQSG